MSLEPLNNPQKEVQKEVHDRTHDRGKILIVNESSDRVHEAESIVCRDFYYL